MKVHRMLPSVVAGIGILISGCVSEVEKPVFIVGSNGQEHYEPLKDYQLKLQLVSERVLMAGKPAKLTFSLTNMDPAKPISIPEWHANATQNIQVYCQLWFPDMEKPEEELWVPIEMEAAPAALRQQVDLNPGNQVMVTKLLPFVEYLVIPPGSERRYFIKAELTLDSVKAVSPVAGISVQNPAAQSPSETE